MASPLRKWMRKEDIYDVDLEKILAEFKVESPPKDFGKLTQKDWDEIFRRGTVERFKELKDQNSRNRLEKKMKKLEKVWRKESGIKSTSIKKGQKKKKKKVSAKEQKTESKEGIELKKYFKKEGYWLQDLHTILCGMKITKPDHIKKIKSNAEYDEILRQVRVARNKDLKDNDAKLRLNKLMVKFEKDWRKKTGIKRTAKTKNTDKKENSKNPKEIEANKLDGSKLKSWMQKNEVWEMSLYDELLKNEIGDPDKLACLSQEAFEEIIRVVRVTRFKEIKDMETRQRCDKLLIKFEKIWRKESGIKSTSITDKQNENADDQKEKEEPKAQEATEDDEEENEADEENANDADNNDD